LHSFQFFSAGEKAMGRVAFIDADNFERYLDALTHLNKG
jgi:hypothetical protein